jgi:ABC-2 type transport system ATP-binding protein
MILGLTEPDSGTVRVCGLDPITEPVEVKKQVGYLPEEVGFYDDMSGLDNLVYTACLNGIPESAAREKAERLLQRVGLTEETNKKAGKYSRGMRQRLGLADVLIKDPEVIILDEPTLGIDPSGVKEFLNLIVELSREQKITVLFSSHHLHQVQQVCDRVGLFVGGRLLASGDLQSLASQLFGISPYTIEAGLGAPGSHAGDPTVHKQLNDIRECIMRIDGVNDFRKENGIIKVACARDLTAEIAAAVISSGAQLTSLNRREYGLDDIYYRYFEGGDNHD